MAYHNSAVNISRMNHPDTATRIAYVMNHFRMAYQAPTFSLGVDIDQDSQVIIPKAENASIFQEGQNVDLDNVWWSTWAGEEIPFLFGSKPQGAWYSNVNGRLTFHVDLISHVFFFLSGWQEVASKNRDELGRFPFMGSVQQKLGITQLPVVNYYFDILRAGLEEFLGVKIQKRALSGGEMTVFLSHDIDSCKTAWLQGTKHEIKQGKLLGASRLLLRKGLGKDDWFNFDKILSIERKHGAKSSFYFLTRNNRVNGRANADYDITHPAFRKVFQSIVDSGSEIGLHGSLGTSGDISMLKQDLQRIGHPVSGNRYHFLSYDPLRTVGLLEEVGFQYDSSLGFAETVGFRNGYCHPFFLFNHETNAQSTVLEIPLAVMDATLQFKKYMGLSHQEAVKAIRDLATEVKKWNGILSILWHNTHFSEHKYKGWRAVYEHALEDAVAGHATFLTGKEIANRLRGVI